MTYYDERRILRAGFTIVELALVIVVIGILTSITAVAYSGYRERADDAAVSSDLLAMAAAVTSYRTFNNHYPSDDAELATLNIKATTQSYSRAVSSISLTYCTNYKQPSPTSTITPGYGFVGRSASGKIFYVSHQTNSIVREVDAATAATWSGSSAGIWCAARTNLKRYDPTVSAFHEAATGYNYFNDGNWAGFK